MNMNNKADEERFVCDNWDDPEVKLESGGKGKSPARKFVPKPKLDTSEINRLGVTDAQLLKYGLFRSESRIWSRKAISGSVAGIESAVTPNPEPGKEEEES